MAIAFIPKLIVLIQNRKANESKKLQKLSDTENQLKKPIDKRNLSQRIEKKMIIYDKHRFS